MDHQLVAEILTGNSDEITDLIANLPLLEAFIDLARDLDAMPEISKRFYEESRSLYQATCSERSIADLEALLTRFFGPPVKAAGKPLPRKLRKNSTIKYLGGIENDQSLFLLPLKTGEFYGALWPWRRNKAKVEIHMGYCSDWMIDDHYMQLEALLKRSLSHRTLQQIGSGVGGQIHGISLPSFLQMAEMEQSSFTLRVTSAGREAQLHVKDGELIGAETNQNSGCDAAYNIISWDGVTVEIAPADPSRTNDINQPLMHVLMESLKIKDEITCPAETPPEPVSKPRRAKPAPQEAAKRIVRLERAPEPRAPQKRINFFKLFGIALGIFVLCASAAVLALHIFSDQRPMDHYMQLREDLKKTESAEQKLELYQAYLAAYPNSVHGTVLRSEIAQTQQSVKEHEFDQITLKISNLPVDETYEGQAIALYGDFLEKYPGSGYEQRISEAVSDIKDLLDQYYYEELKRAARLDFSQRLRVYKKYLTRFPEGRYQGDVDVLIDAMGRHHLTFLASEDAQCEQTQRWDACLAQYDSFILEFKESVLAEEAKSRMAALKDKRDLAQLRKVKSAAGNDFQKAYEAYEAYLAEQPASSQKQVVELEMAALHKQLQAQNRWQAVERYAQNPLNGLFERIQQVDKYLRSNLSSPFAGEAQQLLNQLESQRATVRQQLQREARKSEEHARIQRENEKQAQQQRRVRQLNDDLERQLSASARYRPKGDGSVTDRTTGLTWRLLDSSQELGGCLNYQAAQSYVKTLRAGGNGAWRLPSASELAGLYKQAPYFPSSGAEWYWSAEAYTKGYHSVADIVTGKPESVFQREHRRQDECGTVRAVR